MYSEVEKSLGSRNLSCCFHSLRTRRKKRSETAPFKEYMRALQTINYVPRVEDDGKTLRCVYEQFDSEGNSLFPGNQKDMDEVELSVDFLEKPREDALPIERSAQVKKTTPLRFI